MSFEMAGKNPSAIIALF